MVTQTVLLEKLNNKRAYVSVANCRRKKIRAGGVEWTFFSEWNCGGDTDIDESGLMASGSHARNRINGRRGFGSATLLAFFVRLLVPMLTPPAQVLDE